MALFGSGDGSGTDWMQLLQGLGASLQDAGTGFNGGQGTALQSFAKQYRAKNALQALLGNKTVAPNASGPTAPGLSGAYSSPDQAATYDGPLGKQLGGNADLIAQYAQYDPEATLPLLLQQATQPQDLVVPEGSSVIDKRTGKPLSGFTPTVKPDPHETVVMGKDNKRYTVTYDARTPDPNSMVGFKIIAAAPKDVTTPHEAFMEPIEAQKAHAAMISADPFGINGSGGYGSSGGGSPMFQPWVVPKGGR